MSFWSIIKPEAGTNLCTNPSFETATTGWYLGDLVSTMARSLDYSTHGGYSLEITPAISAECLVVFDFSAAVGITYTFSIDVRDVSAQNFVIYIFNSDYSANSITSWAGTGAWGRHTVTYTAVNTETHHAIVVRSTVASTTKFYIDSAQIEAKAYATTYIDGSLPGFIGGYAWTGSPHLSTSTRSAQERDGGREYDLKDTYNFGIQTAQGIGHAPITLYDQAQALLPGRHYSGQKIDVRQITLIGDIEGTTYAGMHGYRQDLIDALIADLTAQDQPTWLRYSGASSTKDEKIAVRYARGLDFGDVAGFASRFGLSLLAHDPFWYEDGEASASLTTTQDIANADYGVKRIDGTWSTINTAFNSTIYCFEKSHDGQIYIGGDFTDVGDASGDGIVKYNPITGAFTSLGSGISGGNHRVHDMALAPNGDLYVVGDFLNAGGVPDADYCAKWDLSAGAWVALSSTLLSGIAYAVVIGQDGSVYIGGDFANVAGGTTDYIVKYTTAGAWAAMGDGFDSVVYSLAVAPNGNIYATGLLTASGGVTIDEQVAVWNGTAWAAVGSGAMTVSLALPQGNSIAVDSAGTVYITGNFTAIGGVSANYVARYRGQAWETLSSGTNNIGYHVKIDDNIALFCGAFTSAGGITVRGFALWNGYSWASVPLLPPGSYTVQSVEVINQDYYVSYNTAGTATSAYLNTVTNSGTAKAYPVVHIKRDGGTSATAQWLKNENTNKTIYLNYALLDGEELILDFRPGRRSVTSSYFGDVWRAVLEDSDFSEFYLMPGANPISAYVAQVGSPTMTQYLTWVNTHISADGVAVAA